MKTRQVHRTADASILHIETQVLANQDIGYNYVSSVYIYTQSEHLPFETNSMNALVKRLKKEQEGRKSTGDPPGPLLPGSAGSPVSYPCLSSNFAWDFFLGFPSCSHHLSTALIPKEILLNDFLRDNLPIIKLTKSTTKP